MRIPAGTKTLAFIGSYANASDPGVYACLFNSDTGELQVTDQISGLQNPTFLDTDQGRLKLYALAEEVDPSGKRRGAAAVYDIDEEAGKLRFLNREVTVDAPTCHIQLDGAKRCLFVASYHGGMIGVSPVLEDGRVGPAAQVHQHTGSSVLPVQSQPRCHSVFLDPANRYAFVCDLGLDKIVIYRLDAEGHGLIPNGETAVAPGAGPRHFAFHPTLSYGYVINELNSTVAAFAYHAEEGLLTEIQTVPTLPEDYDGENSCADIHISPDGRFLYGSNRGHDSIAVYAIDPASGKLSLVEHVSTGGGHPRNFALSPDGRFLLAANRDGNNVVTFHRDAETGRLRKSGFELEISKPVCVKFMVV